MYAYACSILDGGIILDKAHERVVHNLAQSNRLPVASLELGVSRFGRGVVDQVLESLLRQGRLS